ncbi:hypothetical protein C497_16572 [Halalkalicoccus jeotgali B3]|uniref:Uncharacterized protein n=1 Tax=Halalkalicoccus jeotgali (strain DSM 18796 / CECT 7217 / JCM 14584 / KCTC 4019 / B3) TaxID=795797 RepID=D8J6R5_HALJB|nr:hypothetical protein HacjB3_02745 [Halalkalicoccus jeotgali B3]ELY34014.1 hypothetical protein C497_16572 [Halalkalicoccus jeotgali B3]
MYHELHEIWDRIEIPVKIIGALIVAALLLAIAEVQSIPILL